VSGNASGGPGGASDLPASPICAPSLVQPGPGGPLDPALLLTAYLVTACFALGSRLTRGRQPDCVPRQDLRDLSKAGTRSDPQSLALPGARRSPGPGRAGPGEDLSERHPGDAERIGAPLDAAPGTRLSADSGPRDRCRSRDSPKDHNPRRAQARIPRGGQARNRRRARARNRRRAPGHSRRKA